MLFFFIDGRGGGGETLEDAKKEEIDDEGAEISAVYDWCGGVYFFFFGEEALRTETMAYQNV